MRRLILGVCLVAGVTIVAAQEPPPPAASASQGQSAAVAAQFEVATVKLNKSGERGGGIRRLPGGRVTVTNMAARGLIAFAYDLRPFQMSGGPSWLENEKFDITAKMEGNPEWTGPGDDRPDPIRIAMQALFADRFKLKLHQETKDQDGYPPGM